MLTDKRCVYINFGLDQSNMLALKPYIEKLSKSTGRFPIHEHQSNVNQCYIVSSIERLAIGGTTEPRSSV